MQRLRAFMLCGLIAAAATLSSGCFAFAKTIRVVGEKNADVYITQDLPVNRGDPKFIGRTGDSAPKGDFEYEYTIPEHLKLMGLLVIVRTTDGEWTFPVDASYIASGDTVTIHFPPADIHKPAAMLVPTTAEASVERTDASPP